MITVLVSVGFKFDADVGDGKEDDINHLKTNMN